jgi:hypothetical protein
VDLLFDKVVLRVDGKAVLLQLRNKLESSAGSHMRTNLTGAGTMNPARAVGTRKRVGPKHAHNTP